MDFSIPEEYMMLKVSMREFVKRLHDYHLC